MILLPAVDIRGGRAVRLRLGDFDAETVYADSPLETARAWVDAGARALHVVDLDGARSGEPRHLGELERMAGELDVPIQWGGGLRSLDDVRAALAAGATRIVLGTAALRDAALLDSALEAASRDSVVVAIDVRGDRVSVAGWTEETAMAPEELIELLRARGVERFVYTDIDRDGMLAGAPPPEDVRRVAAAVGDGSFMCSGGIASLDDLESLRNLGLGNLEGIISGKALSERRFTVAEAQGLLEAR